MEKNLIQIILFLMKYKQRPIRFVKNNYKEILIYSIYSLFTILLFLFMFSCIGFATKNYELREKQRNQNAEKSKQDYKLGDKVVFIGRSPVMIIVGWKQHYNEKDSNDLNDVCHPICKYYVPEYGFKEEEIPLYLIKKYDEKLEK